MYIALVHHLVSGVDICDPALVGVEGERALKFAREVEKLGYDLTGKGCMVEVWGLALNHSYVAGEAHNRPIHGDHGLIFTRRLVSGAWQEDWTTDKKTRNKMEGIVEKDGRAEKAA